uniref:KRAB-A domain-containing protein 2 n=1 Tax=Sipha flava TaxID=143950 RepID=A0A2S2RAL6_9HEMI
MEDFNPKSEFYIRMNKYYLDKPGKKPYTNMKIETIMAEITDAKLNKGAKKRRDYYILQKYDVLTVAEKKYLIHKRTDDKDDIKYVVSYEDLFERLSDYHIRTGHGGVGKMRAAQLIFRFQDQLLKLFYQYAQSVIVRKSQIVNWLSNQL